MASNDLQTLYKLRDALKREEYVKTYNNGINEKQKREDWKRSSFLPSWRILSLSR